MHIAIYGVGALGSNLLVELVRQYPDFEFSAVDFDIVEERNLRTQAFFRDTLGYPKVHAMRTVLERYARNVKYKGIPKRMTAQTPIDTLTPQADLIIDCFDNVASRRLLTHTTVRPVLHCGFSPAFTAEIIWDKEYDVPGDVDPAMPDICTLQGAATFIHFVSVLAAMTVTDYFEKKGMNSLLVTGKKQIIPL